MGDEKYSSDDEFPDISVSLNCDQEVEKTQEEIDRTLNESLSIDPDSAPVSSARVIEKPKIE
jgi:hypothetical protein